MIKSKSKNSIISKFIALSFILLISQNFSAQALDSSSVSKTNETPAQNTQLLNIMHLPTEVQTYMLQLFFQDIISSNSFKNQEEKFEKVRSELDRIDRINNQFYAIIHDSKFTINLIRLIEQKYNVSEIEAAVLLSTKNAGEFIKKEFVDDYQKKLNELFIKQLNKKNLNNIKFLLKLGADVNAKNSHGFPALILIAYFQKFEIVKNATSCFRNDVNTINNNDLLFYKELIKLLLAQKDIDINAKKPDGETVLGVANRIENPIIIQLINEHK